MIKRTIFSVLGLAISMMVAAPSKANAQVVVGVSIGRVVPRPAYVVVHPRPYGYGYYPRRVVFAPRPVYVRPVVGGYYYRGRWCERPYAYRGYHRPNYWRR